jgi:PAS domain S-box-containing protein
LSLPVSITIDAKLVGATLLTIALVALASFVLFHSPKATLNRRFGIMGLTTAGWIAAISLALAAKDPSVTVLLGRVGFACASAIPFTLIWMVSALSDERSTVARRVLVFGSLCLAFILASFSPWIVAGAVPSGPRASFVYGPLHRFFGLYFLFSFGWGLYALWAASRSASGINRLQMRYLLLGISLTGAGAITTNLVVPLVWKTSAYSLLGPYFALLFFSFSAHAIIRHRLMDVKVFVRKGAIYVCAILVACLVFLGVATITTRISGHTVSDSIPLTAAIVIAVIVAISFQPLKRWIQDSFNRYVYRETYDYQRTVREVSRRLSTLLDLQKLLDCLTESIERVLRCESVTIYLAHDEQKDYVAYISKARDTSKRQHPPVISGLSSLVTALKSEAGVLMLEETSRKHHDLTHIAEELRAIGGDMAFPFLDDNSLLGILILGPKLSGDPYFVDDIDLVSTLASQTAIAMKNAALYRQVVLANEHIENIVETMESAVIAVTAEGLVTLFNSAAERLTGLRADTTKGRRVSDLPDTVSEPILATLLGGTPRLQVETLIRNNAGDLCPAIYSTSTLKDRSSVILGVVAVFSDLTKLRELEAEKRRTERLASIGAFVSSIAHEIKNPLVAIKTFAELLPERFTEADFRDEFSKVAMREIERIDELVGRLRGLVAPNPQQLTPVDLREPIEEILSLLRGQLEQTRIRVRTHFDARGALVAGDRAQLKQLFLNILMNAIEAIVDGGEITIRHGKRDDVAEPTLFVEIHDTGTGIPQHLLAKIFDPFITTKPQGSGLGLSICRGIVEVHRANIVAQNNPDGRGATVTLEFPEMRRSPACV